MVDDRVTIGSVASNGAPFANALEDIAARFGVPPTVAGNG
jgi:hypothetical protein